MTDKYLLRVTAGPAYDPSTHHAVSVNTPQPTEISSPHCTASIRVRIQNYRGLPRSAPSTSPYFSHPSHRHDQYSIAFRFTPAASIPGTSLVFGNDFDHPIRHRLPPGFGTAFHIVTWVVDPGLGGDLYSDTPHLYGNVLSSVNVLRVGKKEGEEEGEGEREFGDERGVLEEDIEGGGEGGQEEKEEEEEERRKGWPRRGDAAERKKWFLNKANAEKWVWEKGRTYMGDFFNPYLDFNNFSLKLPGFSLSLLGYLNGDDFLRYVLKNKETSEVYFVVVFALVSREEVEKEEEEEKKRKIGDGKKSEKGKGEQGGRGQGGEGFEPRDDDLD